MKFDLHGVEGTLLAPLWGRAKFSCEYPSVFNDAKAIELVEQIDYDFSAIDEGLRFEGTLLLVARAAVRRQSAQLHRGTPRSVGH